MHVFEGSLNLSASDLGNHLACVHLTRMNYELALGKRAAPRQWGDQKAQLDALQELGIEHERRYIDWLRERNPALRLADLQGARPVDETLDAMRDGADLIVQARLEDGRWMGYADILRRVETPSALGPWSYEVIDTKLASTTRAESVLQISLYSDVLAGMQGAAPAYMYVVAPDRKAERRFREERYRVADYAAYYRLQRKRLAQAVDDGFEEESTYPEPVPHCDICSWRRECDARRRRDDHLSLVADLGGRRMREIRQWGVATLTELAGEPLPLRREIAYGSRAPYERAREQARVQRTGRERGAPYYETLPQEAPDDEGGAPSPPSGLWRLPEPSPGDVFFDIEGDRLYWPHGIEYLFGWVVLDGEGNPEYRSAWALDAGTDSAALARGERAMFERFVDEVMARWRAHPGMHVYHYAPYEPTALKRLMSQYATRANEVDAMLRAELFVDLHAVVRKSVIAGVERYSIKDMEPFFRFERDADLHDANDARHSLERLLEAGADGVPQEMRDTVETYNRDDCESTLRLRDWLEGVRADAVERGVTLWRVARTQEAPAEFELKELDQRMADARDRLLAAVPEDAADRTREEQAQWLLAHILGWHRREENAEWWELFALVDMDEEELLGNRAGFAGLTLAASVKDKQTTLDTYRFPLQETKPDPSESLWTSERTHEDGFPVELGSIRAMGDGWAQVKTKKNAVGVHPRSAFLFSPPVGVNTHKESLLRLGEWVADNGVDAPGPYRAARDLLLARAPRLAEPLPEGAPLARDGEDSQDAAARLAFALDEGTLAVQGPPGSGKTHTGARMICELVRAGKKVGVTSNSHKVIHNLLEAVERAAASDSTLDAFKCIEKENESSEDEGMIQLTTDNGTVLRMLEGGDARVAAGTAWMWTRPEFAESVDVLFVDEAGQLSLANVLAMAPAARSLVLLGDPQQLEQPAKGSHPEGVGASALEHLLRDYGEEAPQTIPRHRGLFLERTHRLPPALCAYTSEMFYESRLGNVPATNANAVGGALEGARLWRSLVPHEGNQSSSEEEAERVRELYEALLSGGATAEVKGERRRLTSHDVMVVSPYNAQLTVIGRKLPTGARVGTVDKFQGQEAPVVIYSMATSSPEDAPRGMEFLYSLSRLNVATSRAQCASIVVASPRLFEPECRTPRQMLLANALCRYAELARDLPPAP